MKNKILIRAAVILSMLFCMNSIFASDWFISKQDRVSKRDLQLQELQEKFHWWPTDAQPSPVKDADMGGYWWMPTQPGASTPWGNRGNILYNLSMIIRPMIPRRNPRNQALAAYKEHKEERQDILRLR
jgi:hypothetical protein